METLEIIDSLLAQLKSVDLNCLREYCSNRNTINICYIDSLYNIQSQQKADEIIQLYSILNQQYSYQLGIRGDGNCFYRAVMLMKIFNLASNNDFVPLEAFIQYVSSLRDIQIDLCAAQVVQGSGLQLIFRIFLMRILSWKQQKIKVDCLMIINEYNSLPELDFAACSIARFMIYHSFQKYRMHPSIKSFVDADTLQNINKNILKQNEYAEGIIIPLAAQIVIQNINQEQGSALRINNQGIIYKPMVMQQPDICQIHLVFSKDHYDSLFLKSECEQFPDFYRISSSKFNLALQNTNCYQNFLYHKKFQQRNLRNSSVHNNQQQSQQSQIQNNFESYQSNSSFQNTPTINPQSFIQKQQQIESNSQNNNKQNIESDIKQYNSSQNKQTDISNNQIQLKDNLENKTELSKENASQQNQVSSQSDKNKEQVQENKDLDISKCIACKKKIYGFSEFYQIKQVQGSVVEKICKICNQKVTEKQQRKNDTLIINQKEYFYLNNQQQVNQNPSQQVQPAQGNQEKQHFRNKSLQLVKEDYLMNPINLKQTQSEFYNHWNSQIDFDFQNFDSEKKVQKEEICLQNSAFMIDLQPQQNKNKIQNLNNLNFNQIQLPSNIKKNQIAPFIFTSSNKDQNLNRGQDNDQYFTATLKPVNQINENDLNQRSIVRNESQLQLSNNQSANSNNNPFKCIQCKGPFNSQKYILQGKKLALICGECLEGVLNNLKKDQNSIIIDSQTYKFGDSIMSRIKEQKLIDKSIQNNNIINPSEQNKKTTSQQKERQQQIDKICNKLNCNFCNKSQYSTYEVSEVQKGGKEAMQRVCSECIYLFVLYYKGPSYPVQFDNKTYKVNEFFGKYLYYLQMSQVKAEVQVQQNALKNISQEQQKCIICNKFCQQRYPVFNINYPQTQLMLGHSCFYYNLNCIKDNTFFIYQNNTYILGSQLKKLAYEHILVQLDLYQKLTN